MTIYIVRPRVSETVRSIPLISRQLTPSDRREQIDEVISLQQSDTTNDNIRRWLTEANLADDIQFSGPITGSTIVEMSSEEARQLEQDVPNILVLSNKPVPLISPRQNAASLKAQITSTDLWHLRAIGLESARQSGFKGTGKGVEIAVLDTGIDDTHPELMGKVRLAYEFDADMKQHLLLQQSYDSDNHGTHVAGLICGTTVGVAPDATLLNGLMLPRRIGTLASFTVALEWAGLQPDVQIVNLSAGISGYQDGMHGVVGDLLAVGVLVVCAIGNEGQDKTRSPGNYTEVLSVGAADEQNRVVSFSGGGTLIVNNHQYTVPDMVAPGHQIYSAFPGGLYQALSGSSMAAAIVSGVAALVLEQHPELTLTELAEQLTLTCKDLAQPLSRQGGGLVQIDAAL